MDFLAVTRERNDALAPEPYAIVAPIVAAAAPVYDADDEADEDGWKRKVWNSIGAKRQRIRPCFIKWVDGKRVVRVDPSVCMSVGESLARAREGIRWVFYSILRLRQI